MARRAQSFVPLLDETARWNAMQRSASAATIAAFLIGPCVGVVVPVPLIVADHGHLVVQFLPTSRVGLLIYADLAAHLDAERAIDPGRSSRCDAGRSP